MSDVANRVSTHLVKVMNGISDHLDGAGDRAVSAWCKVALGSLKQVSVGARLRGRVGDLRRVSKGPNRRR